MYFVVLDRVYPSLFKASNTLDSSLNEKVLDPENAANAALKYGESLPIMISTDQSKKYSFTKKRTLVQLE